MQPTLYPSIPLLEWRKVSYAVNGHPILNQLSASIFPSELLLILGENGAGKTTLLKLAQGIAQPDHGQVYWSGEQRNAMQVNRQTQIGWLGHAHRFYLELTAQENLTFVAALHHLSETQVLSVLNRVGLSNAASIAVAHFSTGMLKRLGIARLLLQRPCLWLLDEPYVGLDAQAQAMLDQILKEQILAGNGIVMATHQFTPIVQHTSRVLIVKKAQAGYDQSVSDVTQAQCEAWLSNK